MDSLFSDHVAYIFLIMNFLFFDYVFFVAKYMTNSHVIYLQFLIIFATTYQYSWKNFYSAELWNQFAFWTENQLHYLAGQNLISIGVK